MSSLLVHLVADFGGNRRSSADLAFSEVESRLLLTPNVRRVLRTAVGAFNVLEASFVAAQLGLDVDEDNGHRVVIFANVDARTHTKDRIANGDGAPCFLGELANYVRILGPGLATFSIARYLGILRKVDAVDMKPFMKGGPPGQFRSRDLYPRVIRALANGRDLATSEVDSASVPTVGRSVGYVDGFGNLKTTLRQSDCHGTMVTVTIGEITNIMPITGGLFDAPPGRIHMYPGSSGPADNRFMEIGVRGGSATETFPEAMPGVRIEIGEHPEYVTTGAERNEGALVAAVEAPAI